MKTFRWIASVWQPMQPWAQALVLLALRLKVAHAFFLSGLTKIQDWDTTVLLFREEYHVPVLPPPVAAVMGAGGELCFPVLIALGLAGRFGALGLFVVNIVAVISYPGLADAAREFHVYWGLLLATIAVFGSGRFSLDALLLRGFWRRRGFAIA